MAAAKPEKIILFDSYARGEASEDSDLDFLVIVPTLANKHQEIVRLRRVLRPLRIPVEVLVASKAEVEEWGTFAGHHAVPGAYGRESAS
ncbi:MAG: nucleotidyltransferase domain-containing protein [candidate division KSB1 bacterium]|nr:nucleotidyltransferase domain-containing protein [candidate division KSB1 bacterium]MDZ7303069.1 nucleotidyltransferase domain-containing protein [candidate division KSB1 bacterium]MDZ7314393.1 nucleotidyltransferase domain-containing protein [candidate division KSB1 bacterium]